MKRVAAFVVVTGLVGSVVFGSALGFAQGTAPKPAPGGRHHRGHPPRTFPDAAAPTAPTPSPVPAARDEAPPASTAKSSEGDAGAAIEAKTLDGGTRVFRFGEVEIEGRMRSPQLVYFLRRVRAEFAAGDLGHRSFMRELSETRRDPSF